MQGSPSEAVRRWPRYCVVSSFGFLRPCPVGQEISDAAGGPTLFLAGFFDALFVGGLLSDRGIVVEEVQRPNISHPKNVMLVGRRGDAGIL